MSLIEKNNIILGLLSGEILEIKIEEGKIFLVMLLKGNEIDIHISISNT